MEKCQRCKSKDYETHCLTCDNYNCLCQRCDSYLHSLPSKLNHKRISKEQFIKGEYVSQTENNSPKIKLEESNEHINNSNNTSIDNLSERLPGAFHPSTILNSKFYTSNTYSREYLNEVKEVFRKEKNALEFKNRNLEQTLERLKISFSEQISSLTKELEEIQHNNQILVDSLKAEYENKIEIMKNEQIEMLNNLKETAENFEKEKTEKDKFTSEDKQNDLKTIQELNERVIELENIVQKKDEEIANLKHSFDCMTEQNEKMLSEQKENLVKNYENRMAEIVGNVESTKQNLMQLVDKRDTEIKNALQKSQNEIDELNKIIIKLKEENECHKVNLIKIRDEREFFRSKVDELSRSENDLFNESQIQNTQIQQLKNDNDNLRSENDQLKCELSKLDKLIYGKIRHNFKTNN